MTNACSTINPIEQQKTPTKAVPIISLRDNLPKMMEEAQKGNSGAYLVRATISIGGSESISPISATFYSMTHPNTIYTIDLEVDGQLTPMLYKVEYPTFKVKPIEESDWQYDSQEALDRFLEDPEISELFRTGIQKCTILVLERVRYIEEQPLLWRLTTGPSCTNRNHYYLDAVTGERTEKPPEP
jgi:hypothetical protein